MIDSAVRELAADASSRKRFLRMVGGAGAVGALSVLLAACGDDDGDGAASRTIAEPSASGAADLEIVNYALTLEYVEADFYRRVIESGVVQDAKITEVMASIAETEREHVDALQEMTRKLGGPALARPKTDFDEVLAGGVTMVLGTAATVENLGAAAYLGQAPNIGDKEILAAALAIHSVEARHAAALNRLAGRPFQGGGPLEGSIPGGAFAKPMTMDQVLERVKPFIAG